MSSNPQPPQDSPVPAAQTNHAPATAGLNQAQTPSAGHAQPSQAPHNPSLDDALLDTIATAPALTLARPADPADSKASNPPGSPHGANGQPQSQNCTSTQNPVANVRNNPPGRPKSKPVKPTTQKKRRRPAEFSANPAKHAAADSENTETEDGDEAFGTDSESEGLPPQWKPLARSTVIRTIEARLRSKWKTAAGGEFKQLVDQLAKLRGWDKEEESKDIGPPDPAYVAEWAFSDGMHRQTADKSLKGYASRTLRDTLDLLQLEPRDVIGMLRAMNSARKPRAFVPYEWSATAQAPEGAEPEPAEAPE